MSWSTSGPQAGSSRVSTRASSLNKSPLIHAIRLDGGRLYPRKANPTVPQEAGAGEVILSKRNELGLLSNFAATPFVFRGRRDASLEGFWQMMLYPEGPNARWILRSKSRGQFL